MSYGAYLDITKYDTFTIDENWAKIMSILYRPVTKKQGEFYQIKPYDGVLRPEGFGEVPMDIHFGALFFLLGLSTDLLSVTLNSLKEMELAPNIKSILVKSGKDIPLLLNLQKGMLDDLMKSLRNL
jgi:hypothetical protein